MQVEPMVVWKYRFQQRKKKCLTKCLFHHILYHECFTNLEICGIHGVFQCLMFNSARGANLWQLCLNIPAYKSQLRRNTIHLAHCKMLDWIQLTNKTRLTSEVSL